MASPNPLKRPFHEIHLQDPLHQQDGVKTNEVVWDQTQPQPFSTELPSIHTSNDSGFATEDTTKPSISSTKPSNKRKKLTLAEQEAKKLEKEAKDRQRAEEKEAKDRQRAEEKAKLEENRRAKETEKEEKRKAREAQIKSRDEERHKREEEKCKKEKSQLRLNSFFAQPFSTNSESDSRLVRKTQSPMSSRRSSIASNNESNADPKIISVTTSPRKNQQSDYQRAFPSFFLQSHTAIALQNRFTRDENRLVFAKKKIDEGLDSASEGLKRNAVAFSPHILLDLSSQKRVRVWRKQRSVKDIVGSIHGTFQSPIDLTVSMSKNSIPKPTEELKCISMKYLKFAEDVRPPYIGTYTKVSIPAASKLRRNPFTRSLPSTDYDYDSEAEWEEPGEGEDLDSEMEEDIGDDEEGDEMEGFLDDEETNEGIRSTNPKHRTLIGDLEPISTGLCWEVPKFQGPPSDLDALALMDLRCFKLDIISDHFKLPIDPYLATYWQSDVKQPEILPHSTLHASANPSRVPLNVINRTNDLLPKHLIALDNSKAHISVANMPAPTAPSKTPKRLISTELMDSFKAAIRGSDLTKAGLVEVLKKQFPKQSKDAIKDTIGLVAERVGAKEADKRWVIRPLYSTSTTI